MVQEASQREAYGQALLEMGKTNPDIVVLDADLCKSTMTFHFAAAYPGRAFDVGIAEQNMIGIAAGLAASGKIPFASTFAVFLPGRCFDQVRMSVAQPRLNVKLVVTHGGISVGEDGASHQAIEDISLMTSMPGFTVIVPADAMEAVQAVKAAAAAVGPYYIRLGRPKLPVVCPEDYKFVVGKAAVMRKGSDATIMADGIMVAGALEAADLLKKERINCRVLNMATLKPIDEAAIISAAADTGAIVTAEEHLEQGGLGSAVARVLVKNHPVPMEFISMDDTYGQSGKPAELLQKYGLTANDIANAVRKVIKRKP
ncbi:MAG: transketolase family protein [Dehalococcoidales bacterium]|nr:transketolase family protein [Dehalococcoidales bacterium]